MKTPVWQAALAFALLLGGCSAREPAPAYDTRPGAYATAPLPLEDEDLEWYSRFALVESGDLHEPGDPDLAELRRRGTRFLLYDWMPAGYHYTDGGPDFPLMQWVYANREQLTLNPDGPFPHCEEAGYDWCEDYYYNLGSDELLERRVADVTGNLEAAGAAGVFFDWGPGVFIEEDAYAPIRQRFAELNPGCDYLAAVGGFYSRLRAAMPDRLIVSNQGFRNPENVLPYVDYDITESYAVSDGELGRRLYLAGRGWTDVPGTVYFPVSPDFRHGELRDTIELLDYLSELASRYAGGRFGGYVYLGYAAPEFVQTGTLADGTAVYEARPPRAAIYYGYAVPLLKGWTGYTEVPWDRRLERLPLYFADLGAPLGDDYEDHGGYFLRCYEKGLVVVGEGALAGELTLRSPCIAAGRVYDLYRRKWLRAGTGELTVNVEPAVDEASGGPAPWGRVFVYAR
ncbi:hypothetical protein [Oceanithermus sp.]